jgi:hypothetical protein
MNTNYKSIDKDILISIISKSIFYARKLTSNINSEDQYVYKNIRIVYKDKQTKMYMLVLSDKLPPLICKSKKECVTYEQLNDMKIRLLRKTADGITQFTINYKNIPIGLIDDSPTFLNSLSENERAFMEHFIGILTKILKNTNMNVNIKASNYFKNMKYPFKLNIIKNKNKNKTVRWNNKVNVRLFQKNNIMNTALEEQEQNQHQPQQQQNESNLLNVKNMDNYLKGSFKRRKTIRNNTNRSLFPVNLQ